MWLLLSMAGSLSCGSRLAAPHRALWLGCACHMGEGIVESPPSPPVWLNHTVISLSRSVQTLACVWTAVMRTNTEGPNGAPMMTIFSYIYIWCINKKIHIWMYIKNYMEIYFWDHCCPLSAVGSKKDRHGCEVLTLMLQALQSIVASEALPADKILVSCLVKPALSLAVHLEHIHEQDRLTVSCQMSANVMYTCRRVVVAWVMTAKAK